MDAAATDRPVPAMDRVRERRNALRVALDTLEAANAAPAAGPWRERMTAALELATAMLADHVAQTEAAGGFFDDVVRHEPRVHQLVDALRDDHVVLQREIARLTQRCASGSCGAAEMRTDIERLMAVLHRHRRDGADLLYEAYEVDVATAD